MSRIGFEKIVRQDVPHKRGDNANYQLSDLILLALVGMIGGTTSIAKLCVVWSDGVLHEISGWVQLPVETTISRLFKEATEKQINQLESVNHRLREQIWRRANRSGASKKGFRPNGSILTPPLIRCAAPKLTQLKATILGTKAARSYHPQLAFLADSKEILQAWFRTGSAYQQWQHKPLDKDHWVYIWADGIYSSLRSEDTKLCALVIIGVNERGQ